MYCPAEANSSNLEGRIQGNLDIPLNDQGRTESRALAEYLAPIPFKEAYSSHLSRATEVSIFTPSVIDGHSFLAVIVS